MCCPTSMNMPADQINMRKKEINANSILRQEKESESLNSPKRNNKSNGNKRKTVKKQQRNSNNNKKNKNNKKLRNTKSKKQKKQQQPKEIIEQEMSLEEQGRYVALDCEFVGVGKGGYDSALARVSAIDWDNNVLIDTYVKVNEPVTNYRTFVSGVSEEHLTSDLAMDLDKCVDLVKKMLQNKILVGHGLKNDLTVLGIDHPWYDIRDTAKYEPYWKKAKKNDTSTLPRPRKLKDLAFTKLNRVIQKEGESHCSIEDAIAALDLYKKARMKWEKAMAYKVDRTRQIQFFDELIESEDEE